MTDEPTDERRRRPWPREAPILVLAGGTLGVLGRDVPLDLAARIAGGRIGDCGPDESILACAIDNLDEVFVAFLRFSVALLALLTAGVLIGIVLALVGVRRRQPWLVAAGAAVLVPVVWQAGSIALHLLT